MRKCDSPCHDDVIIRLGDDDVIVGLGNAVTRWRDDVILNDGEFELKSSSQDVKFAFCLSSDFHSINALFYYIHRGFPHATSPP